MIKWLLKHLEKQPLAICIEYRGKKYTFEDVFRLSAILSQRIPLRKNDIFAFCLYNTPLNIFCHLACWIKGITTLPLNPRFKWFALQDILTEFKPKILLTDPEKLRELQITAERTKTILWNSVTLNHELMQSTLEINASTPVINSKTIHLTSGSEGHYKGCVHTLHQLMEYAEDRAQDMEYSATDKILVVLSLNHAFAFSMQLLPALVLGIPMILIPVFDPQEILQTIKTTHATTLCLLPTFCYQLAITKQQIHDDSNYLRWIIVAGDTLPPMMRDKIKAAFGFAPRTALGMTECLGYILSPDPNESEAIGPPLTNINIQITKEHEILVQSNGVMQGYWQNPQETELVLQDGWLHTGDLGYLDQHNYLWFKGRGKRVIVRGGSKISPEEIERAIYAYPGIKEAAVVAKKDPLWLQVPVAFISTTTHITEVAVQNFLSNRLADYKIPHRIVILPELNKTAIGKIDYPYLQVLADGLK